MRAKRGNLLNKMKNTKQPAIYIMSNKQSGTLYTGVTSYLKNRIFQHKKGLIDGFSNRYKCKKLVYYELFDCMIRVLLKEKD